MNTLLTTAIRAAQAAAEIHQAHFREIGVEEAREKAHSDFVSKVDLEAQRAAIEVIRSDFPEHTILAEEETDDAGMSTGRGWPEDDGFLWIIDPLDGTTNYLHGHPMFVASVGVGRAGGGGESCTSLSFRGVLEAGAVVAPRTEEQWWAARGEGAWKNGEKIGVSGIRTMGKTLIGTGFPFKEPEIVPRYLGQLGRVLPASGGVRRGGSAALDFCYLAEGILDGFWEEDYLSPWDSAAGLLILAEAGGVAARLDGSPIDLGNGSILAANSKEIFSELGRLVNQSI